MFIYLLGALALFLAVLAINKIFHTNIPLWVAIAGSATSWSGVALLVFFTTVTGIIALVTALMETNPYKYLDTKFKGN
jgi:hypothetical protein